VLSGVLRSKGVKWRRAGAPNDRLEWVARNLGATFVDLISWIRVWTLIGMDFTETEMELDNLAASTLEFVE
jgi:hypothetical protein